MTSDTTYTQAYVWAWLPENTEPVVAGLLTLNGKQLVADGSAALYTEYRQGTGTVMRLTVP